MAIKVNQAALKKLLNKVDDAFAEVVTALDNEFHSVINDPSEFADLGLENQDIVDTGRFDDSQQMTTSREGGTVTTTFEWNPHDPETGEPYAGRILTGFRAYGHGRWIPGRDWTDRAVKRVDPVMMFENELRTLL